MTNLTSKHSQQNSVNRNGRMGGIHRPESNRSVDAIQTSSPLALLRGGTPWLERSFRRAVRAKSPDRNYQQRRVHYTAIAVILGAVNAVLNPAKLAELRLQPREGLLSILRIILERATTEKGRAQL